ncbi:uncharacterized protein LOC141629139 [Silene latifolia]|uniref:uncharacterized protein LOC141629139 n=1 Tax=Silene latifolia TaxID=37657 RepID=UPI003D787A83
MGHDGDQCKRVEQRKKVVVTTRKVWRPVSKKTPEQQAHEAVIDTVLVEQAGGKSPVKDGQILTPPIKRLTILNRRREETGGYSKVDFGAQSYNEVASSPPPMKSGVNGLFGLLETKIKNKIFSKAVNSFNNGWCISTNNGYHSGGRIWILWQPKMFRVNFIEYNAQFIHMKVESLLDKGICYLTMVYAFNGIQDRASLWNHLRKIAGQTQGPWAIAGDFNCILAASERYGGASTMAEMKPFRRCVVDCEVVDITATGSLYTWNNKQRLEERIYSRIDRFLVNKEWCDLYPEKYAHFLPEGLFDPSPCLIRSSTNMRGKSSFKYLNMWGSSKEFLNIVKKYWDRGIEGTPLYKLTTNLKGLKAGLYQLNRDAFSDIKKAIAKLQQEVEGLQAQLGRDPDNMQLQQQEFEAYQELKIKSLARDSFLHQRAKSVWIKEGDTNSAYFHNSIRHRRNKNRVILIEDMDGNLSHSATLLRPVTGEEVKDILFSIPDVKSPGPDGYTSRFFKDAWGEIGKDVIIAVLDFFQHGKILKQINAINLTMVPKCDRPQSVLQFRPIACCNVVYKVISKLLCARLAEVLPCIVDKNQGAFIQHRSIQENILICQDLIRLYESPSSSPRCMFKIHLQKAYDTVEWEFVDKLMIMLKFPLKFRVLVMQCITTTSFSISLNGEMFGFFPGKRGLRQGDPLSPLIFTLCMEYLTRTLKYAAARYDFAFHPMCKEMGLTNLMFADDVLMFSKGDAKSMMLLLRSFSTFSRPTGLKISAAKSNAYFCGVSDQLKQEILSVSGLKEGELPFRYLGLPIQTTRLQKKDCECLVEKICSKIHGYGARKFSFAGRLTLVQAVLKSLCSYWASLFVLPKGIIQRVEATCRNFLWDGGTEYRRAPLVAWDKVCRTKEEGGLGLQDMEMWNKALVGRLVDWIYEGRNSVWVKWVECNHLKGRTWSDYEPSTNSSLVWRRICRVKTELAAGYLTGKWHDQPNGYSPASYYRWLRGVQPKQTSYPCYKSGDGRSASYTRFVGMEYGGKGISAEWKCKFAGLKSLAH